MRAYGATVTLTSAKEGILGSRDYADKKLAEGGYIMLNQFANEDNWNIIKLQVQRFGMTRTAP
jgi:cysteine synthase B